MKDQEKKHYSLKELTKMFRYVQTENKISNREYEIFCEGIYCLPIHIVDSLNCDVYFVILSSENRLDSSSANKKLYPACWVPKEDFKDKKGIIFLSPCFFKYDARKNLLEAEVTTDCCTRFEQYKEILHEVAHFYKEHKGSSNKNKHDKQEDEAETQAIDWLKNCKWSDD